MALTIDQFHPATHRYIVWLIEPSGRRCCAHSFTTLEDAESYGIAQIDGKAWSHYEIIKR